MKKNYLYMVVPIGPIILDDWAQSMTSDLCGPGILLVAQQAWLGSAHA